MAAAAVCLVGAWVPGQSCLLNNGKIELSFLNPTATQFSFDYIRDVVAGTASYRNDPINTPDLWTIALKSGTTSYSVTPVGQTVNVVCNNITYPYTITAVWPSITVTSGNVLTVTTSTTILSAADDVSRWRISTSWASGGSTFAITRIDFPTTSISPNPQPPSWTTIDNRLVLSRAGGFMIHDPVNTLATLPTCYGGPTWAEATYPGDWSIQLGGIYDVTTRAILYLSCEDDAGYLKRFAFASDGTHVKYRVSHVPQRVSGAAYTMTYDTVIGAFQGRNQKCWYDMAARYRTWATNSARPWVARGLLETTTDVPNWFKNLNMHLAMAPQYKPPFGASAAHSTIAFLTSIWDTYFNPNTVTWYRWTTEGDDSLNKSTPEQIPDPNFITSLATVQAAGDRGFIYFSPTVYGVNAPLYASLQASTVVVDENGAPVVAPYDQFLDATCGCWKQNYSLGRACQASNVWLQHYQSNLLGLINSTNIDGIYMDFWSGISADECFSTGHGHAQVGGGNFYQQGKIALGASVRQKARNAKPDFIMTSEAPDETLIGVLDMVHHADAGNQGYFMGVAQEIAVPLFATVYHEYIFVAPFMQPPIDYPNPGPPWIGASAMFQVFGRACQAVNGEVVYSAHWASNLSSLGYVGCLADNQNPAEARVMAFLVNEAACYGAFPQYLRFGRRQRPMWFASAPVPGLLQLCGAPWVSVLEFEDGNPIVSGVWKDSTGRIAAVFANWDDVPQSLSYSYNPLDYDVNPTASYSVYLNGSTTPVNPIPITGPYGPSPSVVMPPGTFYVVEFY
jgi:hypothetical protein